MSSYKHSLNTDITDEDELEEFEKIQKILNSDGKVQIKNGGIRIISCKV
jgi:hypothetical protein